MGPGVTQVIAWLKQAGLRTEWGYPGMRAPLLEAPALAVNLEKGQEKTVTMAVTVFSPAALGGEICDSTAASAANVLRGRGAVCTQEGCRYDGKNETLSARVLASWTEPDPIPEPQPVPEPDPLPFTVWLDGSRCPFATSVAVKQTMKQASAGTMGAEPELTLSDEGWTLTLTEDYPQGIHIPRDASGEFTLAVDRQSNRELFLGCRWISVQRQDSKDGTHQIRVGISKSREAIALG